jgi:hypothetical protein
VVETHQVKHRMQVVNADAIDGATVAEFVRAPQR